MGPYNNSSKSGPNRLFGQTMKKSDRSSKATRYQRQFGNGNQKYKSAPTSADTSQKDEANDWRRIRQEQQETIDAKFGYYRLEDRYQEQQKTTSLGMKKGNDRKFDKLTQRRGWLFNMAATTVSFNRNMYLLSASRYNQQIRDSK